jgi:hypothetical protein
LLGFRPDAQHFGRIAALAITISLTGCLGTLSSKLAPTPPPTPAWVTNPPPDTPSTYFGIGQGPDLPGARRAALRDIAAKIKVSIAGRVESRIAVRNNDVDRSALSRVSEEVQKTEFKNFTVVNTSTSADGVYALVSVDRQEFVRDTKEKIQKLTTQIDRATAGLDSRPPIEQYMVLKKQRPNIVTSQGYYDVIGRQDLGPDDQVNQAKLDDLLSTSERVTANLSFKLQSVAPDKDIEGAVSTFLTNNGVRTQAFGGSAAATINVSANPRLDTIQNSKTVRLTVNLQVIDGAGRALAAREYVVSGTSLTDHASARQQAVFNLATELRKADLPGGLGFNFN